VVWDGEIDSDFLTDSNWEGDSAPTAGDDAVLNNGGVDQPTLGAGDSSTVNTMGVSAGTLTLDGNLTATSGTTVSGTGTVDVNSGGLLTGNVGISANGNGGMNRSGFAEGFDF
jgi:hypothetical protein